MDALFSDYEAIRKSGLFDPEYYLASYPDVGERNLDPLVHYLEEGAAEGRNPHPDFDSAFYLEQCRERGEAPNNPLMHYLRVGAARGFKPQRDRTGSKPSANSRRPPADPDGRQPILVAIEALGVVGAPDGSSRASVAGWALAATPISEIAVELGGSVMGTATCGLPRPDIARLYPERGGAANSGFVLAFNLPGRLSGVIEPMLTVRTADGEAGRRPLRVEIPPQQMAAGIVDPLDAAASRVPGADKPPMRLHIDSAGVDPGGILRVEGWVVSLVQIEAVDAFVEGAPIGRAEFGLARADVAETQSGYPNSRFSGFRLAADIGSAGGGRRTIAIRAAARDGVCEEAIVSVEVPRLSAGRAPGDPGFYYRCEESTLSKAGRLVLRGWAVGPSPIIAVAVTLDGDAIGQAEIGLARPDIGNQFPGIPHARQSGFSFETSGGPPAVGEHRVMLRFRRADGQDHEAVLAVRVAPTAPPVAPPGDQERLLRLDLPHLIDGAVDTPIRGTLTLAGWALAPAGVAEIEIAIDGMPIAIADYGIRRLDVHMAFPERDDALGSGYQALVPRRALLKGRHRVTVTLRDKAGGTESLNFRIEVEDAPDGPGPWALRRKMPPAEIDLIRRILQRRSCDPRFVAVLPIGGNPSALPRARLTIASLAAQAHASWRLLAIAPGQLRRETLLDGLDVPAERIEIVRGLTPAQFAARAGAAANEMFFTVLAPGDELGCDAFLELAMAAVLHRDADFLYSDERCVNPASGTVEAYFKPQWSPDLLLSTNYIGRLWCARADLLSRIAEPGAPLLHHGEYDLVLRCTEAANAIRHVAAVLCERAPNGGDAARQAKAALARLCIRRGILGDVRDGLVAGTWRVERALVRPGLVSIIIPTCAAQGLIKTCIETLRRLTRYRDYEIVCIENIPAKDRKWRGWLRRNADRVISPQEAFNWSRFNNLAAAAAKGQYLLFLNDDVEIIDPGWLDALVAEAQRPEVGVVGPLLLYPDRRVQHAGVFLTHVLGQSRHAFRYAAEDDPGYFGLGLTQRNVIAVTGACFLTSRETFDALGGFDEAHGIINNDVDYCLRAWQSGRFTLYTPHARLIHHERISRDALDDEFDVAEFDRRWQGLLLAGDPFFSPHLSTRHDDFQTEPEPTETTIAGWPALLRDEIRNILVLKLDHIGDCITALPAVRRLKRHFPLARIAVLTSRAARPVWAFEAAVEKIIEFDFFHARSGLGELEHSEEDWAELGRRLAAEHFDLAVDLRKHVETRPVLRRSGARYLAGFDHHGQFAWLDVALEWDGDRMSMRKRQWAGDDLVNLVDAIAAACEDDREVIALPPARLAAGRKQARAAATPAIWVHPTSGNDIKQWPAVYFAVVIDQLVEAYGAKIFLTGAPGDEEVADGIVGRLRHPEAVTSMIGKSPLAALPELMAGAALFLGNDSGLKHIAAGLGIPTVAVHGGTLDAREWGGVGPSAVSVARNMVCSPCYLAAIEDCRRGVACLRQLEPGRVYEACAKLLALSAAMPAAASTPLPANAPALTPGSPQPRPRRSPRPRQPGSP
jgi:ADP-heptose:LPS heptosyltransferase/GT2 family glycosyltransferase